MKKLLFSAFMATAFMVGASAQTVISNNYDTPISAAGGQSADSSDDDEEMLSGFNLVYYGFDGFQNYGISDYFLNPNGIGGEFNIRANFEKYGNYNFDVGVNYTFKLWQNDNAKLLLTAAVGPSFRMQDKPEISYTSKGKVKEESKTQYKFDLYANARLMFNIGHFALSAGYFLWGAEFKFEEGYKSDGYNIAVGWYF